MDLNAITSMMDVDALKLVSDRFLDQNGLRFERLPKFLHSRIIREQ
jgi:hypothetical protein